MADTTFYETSAQVIALLLLAAGVETKWLQNLRPLDDSPTRWKAYTDALLLPAGALALFAGELAALHVSLTGVPTPVEERLTVLALLVGCFGVFTPILNAVIGATSEPLRQHGGGRLGRIAGFTAMRLVHATLFAGGAIVLAGWMG